MGRAEALPLWEDDEKMLGRVVRRFVEHAVVSSLAAPVPVLGPAVYAVLLGSNASGLARDLLRPLAGSGVPLNVGSQIGQECRAMRHRLSLQAAPLLNPEEWLVAILPVGGSRAAALAAERLLQDHYAPLFNDPRLRGFGSNRQGVSRAAAQVASPWDTVFGVGRAGRSQNAADDRQRSEALVTYVLERVGLPLAGPPLFNPTGHA